MPDPVWTMQYAFNKTPEGNGFTRTLYGSPVITEVTGGNPANRRVDIDSTNGDAVFLTSQVPSLDSDVGSTIEMVVAVGGNANGNAGFEMTFLNRSVLIMVFPSKISVTVAQDPPVGQLDQEVATASNSGDTEIRATFDAAKNLRVYRNDVEILGPINCALAVKPFQRVLWWAEAGAIATFRAMRFYIGGAVIPG